MAESVGRRSLDEILQSTSIVEVAQRLGLPVLTRAGRSVTNCLWHEDKRPSLTLYDNADKRPHYHCYVCGAHGDAIDLAKEARNEDFWPAFMFVAEAGGHKLPQGALQNRKKRKAAPANVQGLQLAWDYYAKNGDKPRLASWAEERSFDPDFLEKSEAAWIPGKIFQKRLTTWGRDEIDFLLEAGVLIRSTRGRAAETGHLNLGDQLLEFFFEDRVIFPIREENGQLQGFAGRLVAKDGQPKYLYTRGFRRSTALYGIDRVHKALAQTQKQANKSDGSFHLFVVEGFMDVLRLESLGLHAVALLGNALSVDEEKSQLTLLKRLQEKTNKRSRRLLCHLFLDQDDAGRSGTARALPHFLNWAARSQSGVTVDVIAWPCPPIESVFNSTLPKGQGKDPDELLRSISTKDAETILAEHNFTALEFLLSYYSGISPDSLDLDTMPVASVSEAKFQTRQVLQKTGLKIEEPDVLLSAELRRDFTPKPSLRAEAKQLTRPVEEPKFLRITDEEEAETRFRELHRDAVGMARNSVSNREFPGDPASWNRLEQGLSLFWRLQWEALASSKPREPYLPVLLPRADGGEPRLKVQPCPEDLALQMYMLRVLLRYADAPAVIYDRQFRAETRETRGIKLPESAKQQKSQAVSFAYQISQDSLLSGSGTLFRHYSDCWRDYNTYILNRVQQCRRHDPSQLVYSARLDIRRYYDSIPEYAVVDFLKPRLKDEQANAWRMLLRLGNNSTYASDAVSKICHQVFGYEYHDPRGRKGKLSYTAGRGIPQGPDLSAWLGTIVLFPVDETMAKIVDEIIQEWAVTNERSREEGNKSDRVPLPVATYARYVDDIVLLAPSRQTLDLLWSILERELKQLGLQLSAKAEPVEPRTAAEFERWILEHGGIHPQPSVTDFEGTEVISLSAFRLRASLGALTRADSLSVLYSDSVLISLPPDGSPCSENQAADVFEMLRIVGQAVDGLRHNDWVRIAAHLWDTFAALNIRDPKDAIDKYKTEWAKLPASPAFRPSASLSMTSDVAARRAAAVELAYPVMIAFEGLERCLIPIDRQREATIGKRARAATLQSILGEWVKNGLLQVLRNLIAPPVVDELRLLLNSRLLAIGQLAGSLDDDSRSFVAERQGLMLMRRHLGVSGLSPDTAKLHEEPELVLHGLVRELQEYPSANIWDTWDNSLKKWADDGERTESVRIQFQWLRKQVLPSRSNSVPPTNGDDRLRKKVGLDVLNFFAAIIPPHKQKSLLDTHPHLIQSGLPDGTSLLPNPTGLEMPGILGLKFQFSAEHSENDEINRLVLVWMGDDEEMPLDSLVTEFAASWEPAKASSNPLKLQLADRPLPKLTRSLPDFAGEDDGSGGRRLSSDLLRMITELYPCLASAFSKETSGAIQASAWNILVSGTGTSVDCKIFAWKLPERELTNMERDDVRTARVYAGVRGGLRPIPIPEKNAFLWQAGVILADVLGLLRETAQGYKEPSVILPPASAYLDELMLLKVVATLRGTNWWSRPRPEDQASTKAQASEPRYPAAVELALKAAERYLGVRTPAAQKPSVEQYLEVFYLDTVRHILRETYARYENDNCLVPGDIADILSELPVRVMGIDSPILGLLNSAELDPAKTFPVIQNRVVRAWLLIGSRIEALKTRNSTHSADHALSIGDLLMSGCLFRALGFYLRSTTTQLWECEPSELERLCRLFRDDASFLHQYARAARLVFPAADQRQELLSILEAPTPMKLGHITPYGWLVLALATIHGDAEDLIGQSFQKVSRLLVSHCDEEDVLTGVYQVAELGCLEDGNLSSSEEVYRLILRLEEALREHYIGEAGPRSVDGPVQTDLLPRTWPLSETKSDETFALSYRGDDKVAIRTLLPDRELSSFAVVLDRFPKEKLAEQETSCKTDSKIRVRHWFEANCGGRLVGIGFVSPMIAELSGLSGLEASKKEETGYLATSSTETSSKEQESYPLPEKQEAERQQTSTSTADVSPKVTPPQAALTSLHQLQHQSWALRARRYGRHVRVAFLQHGVDIGYFSPFVELNSSEHAVLKEVPKGASRAEAQRRHILKKVLSACADFQVDALLLPEYSVRPETVLWICSEFAASEYSFSVWAGTYLLTPGWPDKTEVPPGFHENIEEHSAVLTLISRTFGEGKSKGDQGVRVQQRTKKYPSVAAQEFFLPGRKPIQPLAKLWRENWIGSKLPIRAMDFIFELVCSEVFFITSPSNIAPATHAYAELLSRFGITSGEVRDINTVLSRDMATLVEQTSLSHPYNPAPSEGFDDVFKNFPRRSIMLVPACSTRVQDFYLLGKTFHIATGGCVVFCNVADGDHGRGGSCLVGHLSWNSKGTSHRESGKKEVRADSTLTSSEIQDYSSRISPYHGLLPGICLGECHSVAGPLGEKEQALVIVDIDPVHLSEGKPRPQLLPVPQRLIAHLPILEVEKSDGGWLPIERKHVNEIKDFPEILRELSDVLAPEAGPPTSTAHGEHADDLYQVLLKLSRAEGVHCSKEWLERRSDQFRLMMQQQPAAWPPPVAVDWLLVEHDFSDLPTVYVPPLAPPIQKKNSEHTPAEQLDMLESGG